MKRRMVLSIGADAKTVKGERIGYQTGILYLAPGDISGREVCTFRTKGCSVGCLYLAGKGGMTFVQNARIAKTRRFTNPETRDAFMQDVVHSIGVLLRKAARAGLTPLVRLNGTSDIPWENVSVERGWRQSIFDMFPDVQFYDYTKNPARMRAFLAGKMPANYHLTFSRSECNDSDALDILARGGNVAVVFDTRKGEALPTEWHGYPVVDGDISDVRHNDTSDGGATLAHTGKVIGLRAKGPAKRDTTGFVVKTGGAR